MEQKRRFKTIGGWIMVAIGFLWALAALLSNQENNISYLLGAVTVPIIFALVGLYLAGVITKLR